MYLFSYSLFHIGFRFYRFISTKFFIQFLCSVFHVQFDSFDINFISVTLYHLSLDPICIFSLHVACSRSLQAGRHINLSKTAHRLHSFVCLIVLLFLFFGNSSLSKFNMSVGIARGWFVKKNTISFDFSSARFMFTVSSNSCCLLHLHAFFSYQC